MAGILARIGVFCALLALLFAVGSFCARSARFWLSALALDFPPPFDAVVNWPAEAG